MKWQRRRWIPNESAEDRGHHFAKKQGAQRNFFGLTPWKV